MTLDRDWPLFQLKIETPRLSLRYPTDRDLEQLNDLADEGIHDPDWMPFEVPWTDDPAEVRRRKSLQFWWGLRSSWKPTDWTLPMAVIEQGTIVGSQSLAGREFPVTRSAVTGSWVGRRFQGRGIGKEMRAAILHLAFDGLGSRRATSAAFEDNQASLAVSRALGYVENGDQIQARRGKPVRRINLQLDRARWEQGRRTDISVLGLGLCRQMFGLPND